MRRLLVIPLALGILVTAALFWSATAQESPADFTFINSRGDHKTLDLEKMSWLQDIRIAYALWEGLYTPDPVTMEPIPGVAERYDVDPTRTVYTFHLRASARWSDGTPVTSRDFLFAWRRTLEQPAEYTSLHYYIKGAQDYEAAYEKWMSGDGPQPDFSTVGEKAIDDHTFQVTLAQPIPFLLDLCAFTPFFPENEASMRKFAHVDSQGRVTDYDDTFTRPPNLITNGPYYMSEWLFKTRLRMLANPYYWNAGALQNHCVDEVIIEDPMAAFRVYEAGQADYIPEAYGQIVGDMLEQGGRDDLHVFPAFGTYFYTFNCQPKLNDGSPNPLYDVRVRRALTMAVDKTPIVNNVMRGGQVPVENYIPPGVFPGYVSPPGIPYDVAGAQKLLADAGYPDGQGFPAITILFNKEGEHSAVAEVIHHQWLANLKVDIRLQPVEMKDFGPRFQQHDFAVARASWYGDYHDPTTWVDKWRSDNINNEAGWKNAEYDHTCDLALTERDPTKRLALYGRAEKILLDQAVLLPLFQYMNCYLFRPNVTGIPLDSRMMVMFQSVKVAR